MDRAALRAGLACLATGLSGWLVWWCAKPRLAALAEVIDGSSSARRWTLADLVATSVALVAVGAYAVLMATAAVAIGSQVFVPHRASELAARGWAGPRWWRTLVLTACGIGVAAQVSTAAAYVPDPRPCAGACAPTLDGLPYPDLPIGRGAPQPPPSYERHLPPAQHQPTGRDDPATTHVTVHTGDCLWSIAANLSPPHASEAAIADLAAQLYVHNRHTIGADPDFIYPGMVLRAPGGSS